MAKNNLYFAADVPEKAIPYLEGRATSWYDRVNKSGYMDRMLTSWQFYYGFFQEGAHDITFNGESGELLTMPVNNYANLARHIINFITGTKVAFMCKSVNTDRKSMVQARLGNNILNYYAREQNLQDVWDKAIEYAVVMGQGFVLTEWDATKGEKVEIPINEEEIFGYDEYDRPIDENGEVIFPQYSYTGDISSKALSPLDVVYDFTKSDMRSNSWYIVRTFKNKYDLAAKFPDLAEDILSIPTDDYKRYTVTPVDNDIDIPVYQFFHDKTEAVPNGRYLYYINKDVVLADTDLPYTGLPIQRVCYSEILGTSEAHTAMFDLIPLQKALNATFSTVLTNHNAFGTQNILNPMNNGVTFDQVTDGMNWIDYDSEVGPPTALQLTKISSDSYKLIEIYNNYMEILSGVNSVSRGVPNPQLTSGTALALVQAQALQFMNKPQQSYIRLLEDCGTFIINLLKDFADEPRVIAIAGINNKSRMEEFKNDDIVNINRVVVDVANSLIQSSAGRWQVAESMMQYGIITSPEKMVNLLQTGNLDDLIDDVANELDTIKAENEALLAGNPVIAIALDRHMEHIREHRAIISDPYLRLNEPDLIQRTIAHIMEHINLLRGTDPALLSILGEQPIGPVQGSPPAPQDPTVQGSPDAAQVMSNAQNMNQGPAIPSPATPPSGTQFEGAPMSPQQLMEQNI